MKGAKFLTILVVSLFFLISSTFAVTLQELISQKYKEAKDIYQVIKDVITEGGNPEEVTKASIQMGYAVCPVIKAGVDAKASHEQIIKGALEAEAPVDVITKCAREAGMENKEIASILQRVGVGLPGLGFKPAAAAPTPISVGLPGGKGGGGFVSPSTF
jgi:hypothetical protein